MKNSKIKKVAALDKVLQICNAHGASYNPSNEALKPTALTSLLELAQEKTKAVIVAQSAYALAVNATSESFEGIPTLISRVVRMVSASRASEKDKEDAKMIRRQCQFGHDGRNKGEVKLQASVDAVPAPKHARSVSKSDRDSILNTFQELVQLVSGIPTYKPNEPAFQVEGLKAKVVELQALTLARSQAAINLSNARIARDKMLNDAGGVVQTTREARDYIRAVFGATSKESQQTKPSMNF